MLVLLLNIEVFRQSAPVVREDEVFDDGWQAGLLRHLHAFGDMADDDTCTLGVWHVVMWIHTSLILCEEHGVGHLTYVMIKRARTHEEAIGLDAVCYLSGEVSYGDGVLERARCNLAQVAQQALVRVREFEERDIRCEVERTLDEVHERVGQQEEDAVDDEVDVHVGINTDHHIVLHELQGEEDHGTGKCDEDSGLEHLCPTREVAQRVDGNEACHELHDDEFILIFHRRRTDKYHDGMREEGRARIHEHTDEHRHHGKRQDVDAEEVVLHHDGNHNGEDGDERVEHHNRAGLFEVVAPEEGEVECEKQHHDCNEDDLTDHGGSDLALCGAASFHLAFERLQHLEGVCIDDVATVDDFLTGKHHATGDGDTTQHIGALGLAAFLVVDEVRLNILVQVASLQRLSLCFEARVLEKLLVGRQSGIERMHRHTLHLLTRDDLHHRRRVLRQLVEVRRVHDAGLIELV